jgi:hypothetical protein
VRLVVGRGGTLREYRLVDVHDDLVAIGARARACLLAAVREVGFRNMV